MQVWMYNVKTSEAKLFEDGEFDETQWVDSPAKCDPAYSGLGVKYSSEDRDALKEEALALGLEFPSNVKTEKLASMIAEAKGE